VLLNDGRPNGELLLSLGTLQEANLADCLIFPASLVPADRYYGLKQQILESFGFSAAEAFPVFADRFPIQLLAYLRLSRIQDPGLLAKVGGWGGGEVVAGLPPQLYTPRICLPSCKHV
jgi:histone-lysine N-methyltransferase SETD3